MTTIELRDIFAAANDRAQAGTPGSIQAVRYREDDSNALRQALLIRDVEGLLAAAGMTRLDGKDD